MTEKRLVVWPDLQQGARLWSAEPMVMRFELLTIISTDVDGKNPEFKQVAHGSIKWDGCMNYAFEPDEAMLHCCGRRGVKQLMESFLKLYDEAEKLLNVKM